MATMIDNNDLKLYGIGTQASMVKVEATHNTETYKYAANSLPIYVDDDKPLMIHYIFWNEGTTQYYSYGEKYFKTMLENGRTDLLYNKHDRLRSCKSVSPSSFIEHWNAMGKQEILKSRGLLPDKVDAILDVAIGFVMIGVHGHHDGETMLFKKNIDKRTTYAGDAEKYEIDRYEDQQGNMSEHLYWKKSEYLAELDVKTMSHLIVSNCFLGNVADADIGRGNFSATRSLFLKHNITTALGTDGIFKHSWVVPPQSYSAENNPANTGKGPAYTTQGFIRQTATNKDEKTGVRYCRSLYEYMALCKWGSSAFSKDDHNKNVQFLKGYDWNSHNYAPKDPNRGQPWE